MLRPVARAWPEQIMAVKKIQSIAGRSIKEVAGVWPEHLKKVAGALTNVKKDTSEKIT